MLLTEFASAIQSYGKQATLKPGVKASEHSIIFTGDRNTSAPEPQAGEKLTRKPIRIQKRQGSEALSATSRLNFGKIYTVEHHAKVVDLGMICDEHLQLIAGYYNDVHGL